MQSGESVWLRTRRTLVALSCLAVLTAAVGCGSGKRNPVEGKALVGGKPLTKGQVTFYPAEATANEKLAIVGTVGPDGVYRMTTNGQPGVPAGKYKVTVNTLTSPVAVDLAQPLPVFPRPTRVPDRTAHPGYEGLVTTNLTIEVPSKSYDLALAR